MAHWEQVPIPVPYIAERFIAFTVPDDHGFLAVSYEGIHEITFGPPVEVRSTHEHPEGEGVFDGQRLTYPGREWPTMGLYGGSGLLFDDRGHVLELEPPAPPETSDEGWVHVLTAGGERVQSLPFTDCSGAWQHASFSTDYRHIVIGTPYEITIYRCVEPLPSSA